MKKILKRAFAVIFSILLAIFIMLSLIDLDKSIAWNIGKIMFAAFLLAGSLLTAEWIAEWAVEREEKKRGEKNNE